MRLVVTEKPSVARDLAGVLRATRRGDGYLEGEGQRITWCRGHLVELEEPAHYKPEWKRWSLDTLPMLPDTFALRVRQGAADQWKVVKKLMRDADVTDVVNACDAGREGELIFRYAYEHAGCRRPVLRLWLASLTDTAIRDAWSRLRPGADYDRLADAARCRSEADWIVGLNATRAMTCLVRRVGGDQLLSIGRVQTPTLAMIVARDRAIEAFVPETFWQIHAQFAVGEAGWKGTWFQDKEERLGVQAHAEAVAAATRGRSGRVATSDRKRQTEAPPLLYDLTALQRRANQRYGLPADQTLEIAQALYEKHKLITYPRTDARHLTPDQVPGLVDIVQGVGNVPVYAPFAAAILANPIRPGKRVVDAAEVGDHHAIIPTGKTPDPGRLTADEKRIFDLVARRLLAALSDDAVFERTTLIVEVDPVGALPDGVTAPLRYRAKGRVCLHEGWRLVDPPGPSKESDLPRVVEGAEAEVGDVEVAEGVTRPPRPHNDASILQAMETAGKDLDDAELERAMRASGLGTPATRAAILQMLLQRGYVVRQAKDLRATPRGMALIDAIPTDELKSAELTGRWEKRLTAIAEARGDTRAAFMADVARHTVTIVDALRGAEPPAPETTRAVEDSPVLGTCPVCHTPVRAGRAAYSCETGRACAFVVFKTIAKRAVSPRMVKALLTDGRTPVVKGFKSKKGKPFDAGLQLHADGSVTFWFEGQDAAPPAPSPPAPPPSPPSVGAGDVCPECGQGRVMRGRASLGCDRWKAGCGFRAPFADP